MQWLSILMLSILCSVVYGVIHDQITAHICVEYFTIGHVRVIDSDNPIVLAFVWGVIATWWVGATVGLFLATAARWGAPPKRSCRDLTVPLLRVMCLTGVMAAAVGMVAGIAAASGWIRLWAPYDHLVPEDRHVWFLTDFWAHNASYACGAFLSARLIYRTWTERQSPV